MAQQSITVTPTTFNRQTKTWHTGLPTEVGLDTATNILYAEISQLQVKDAGGNIWLATDTGQMWGFVPRGSTRYADGDFVTFVYSNETSKGPRKLVAFND